MENHLIKSASADISFCFSDCLNEKCSRNLKGKLHSNIRGDWISYCDFSKDCSEYKPKAKTRK